MSIEIAAGDRRYVHCALGLHVKRLVKITEELRESGKDKEADKLKKEHEGLQVELIDPGPEQLEKVQARHCPAIVSGLERLAKNQMALKGTLIGAAEWEKAAEMEEKSDQTRSELIPKFSEQTDLGV